MTASKEREDTNKDKTVESRKRHDKKAAKGRKKVKQEEAQEKKAGSEEAESSARESAPAVDESYLRLKADFDNYRKRVLREKDELYRRANEDIMEELLPVLDHLDMALEHAGDDESPVVEGFRMVGGQLLNVLKKFGLSEIEAEGCEFDPNIHEAIVHMPSEEVAENRVVSVARKGYKLGERLLRASQVAVSSGPPEDDESED